MSENPLNQAELFGLAPARVDPEINEEALELRDSYIESQRLGKKFLSEGFYEYAIRHLSHAVTLSDPEQRPEALLDLAGAYEYAEDSVAAFEKLSEVITKSSDSATARVGMSDILRRQGKFAESESQLLKAIEAEPHNSYLYWKLSTTLAETKRIADAIAYARRATELSPDQSIYQFDLAELLLKKGLYDEACLAFQKAGELSPGDDYLYLRFSIALWRAGKTQEAIRSVRLASELDPVKDLYHGVLELLLEEADLVDEANMESGRADQMDDYDLAQITKLTAEYGIES